MHESLKLHFYAISTAVIRDQAKEAWVVIAQFKLAVLVAVAAVVEELYLFKERVKNQLELLPVDFGPDTK